MIKFNSQIRSSLQDMRYKYLISSKSKSLVILPGMLLSALIALVSLITYHNSVLHVLNPLLTSAILGIIVGNITKIPQWYQPGIKFSMKRVLRLSVILLGLKLSLSEVLSIGASNLSIILA
ncbi:MAG: putative sulfate exporter family transporter, partial [Kamptonema sp. SIO4C4]|nr:putative sulfate exporter family transporter [Kamptonema sp. SIO4C4]